MRINFRLSDLRQNALRTRAEFGEKSLRLALNHFVSHHHHERNHQGKDNLLLFPSAEQASRSVDQFNAAKGLEGS